MTKFTADEMVGFLIESEWDDRNNRRVERQIRNARFRYNANIEQLHFDVDRTWRKTRYYALPNASSLIMEKTSLLPEVLE